MLNWALVHLLHCLIQCITLLAGDKKGCYATGVFLLCALVSSFRGVLNSSLASFLALVSLLLYSPFLLVGSDKTHTPRCETFCIVLRQHLSLWEESGFVSLATMKSPLGLSCG